MELWVARDKDSKLYLYKKQKPFRSALRFMSTFCFRLDDNIFPEITWDNSPRKVKIELA